MEKAFSEETHWERAAKTRLGKYLTRAETGFIMKSIAPARLDTVMDVGAEAGRFSLLAKNPDGIAISIDIDSYGLQRLKLKTKHVNIVQADARKIPLKDEVFDAIFMVEVLDYIPEVDEALGECFRTLKSNASLFVSFGNRSSLKSLFREMSGKSYRHSYGAIMRSLFRAGFTVKRKMGYNWLPFGRTSESRLVSCFAAVEKLVGLRKIPRLSPWVIVHAVKCNQFLHSDSRESHK